MIYLSGKITDPNPEQNKKNLERFYEVEERFTGDVFNPARLEIDGGTWEYYLARDLIWIFENRPDMYMMKGWEESKGARLEHETAKQLGLKIEYE